MSNPKRMKGMFREPIGVLLVVSMLLTGCHRSMENDGGTRIILEAVPGPKTVPEITPEVMSRLEKVVSKRAECFSWDSTVKVNEPNKLVVELPGVRASQDVEERIADSNILEFKELASAPNGGQYWKGTSLTSDDFRHCEVHPRLEGGNWFVNFQLTENGKVKFAALTKRLVGQQLGIFLNGAPIERGSDGTPLSEEHYRGIQIREPITVGQGEIAGDYTKDEAIALAIKLNSGSLPVPVKVIEVQSVDAADR
ncbi:hypothetical protein KF707_21030 [Candidatus Obscuribacterales bacterium]|nr:hypothetical protein [Candidatus Obscuribacterales bacterium]